jgi:SAM-dependent methyltransferase
MRGAELAQSNFIYRRPELAERLRRPNADANAQRWSNLINQHHPDAQSVLDLVCWIGVDAERLANRYTVVGVDVQPHLIAYARKHRPGPEFVVGDLSSVRLGRRFDAILCVGNSLSYVHAHPDLEAAFATFSAHAQEDSLLILHTLLAPIAGLTPAVPRRVEVDDFVATYADRSEWNPLTQLLTTHRTWLHDDGTTEADILRRRVLSPPELELRARLAGWEVLSLAFDPPERAGSETDAVGCMVARFRGAARTS